MSSPEPVLRMRIDLTPELSEPAFPPGVSLHSFDENDAQRLHALLEHGYRQGGGSVEAFHIWLPQLLGDSEFDPDLCFLVDANGEAVAAAICWTSAFVKDIVVNEVWRWRGLGEALLRHSLLTFRARGSEGVELKVESQNLGAIRLYERIGMRVVDR